VSATETLRLSAAARPAPDFYKVAVAWQPNVSAANITAGVDAEYVWWITRFYYSQDANVLNGSAWFPGPWSDWYHTYADDTNWYPDLFTNHRTGTRHNNVSSGGVFESYSILAENRVWYSSTGAWQQFWSSDSAGRPAVCGFGGQLSNF
jgi:hypothetical protein